MSTSGHVPIDHWDGPACCLEGCTEHLVLTPEQADEWYRAQHPGMMLPRPGKAVQDYWDHRARLAGFRTDLEALINKHSLEQGSHTPDYLLADYLMGCLDAWEQTTARRDVWRS